MPAKRVLVTGAAGRLGANVVRQLLDAGYEVKALVVPGDPKATKLDGFEVEIVVGDLRDEKLSPALVADVEAVIHTANVMAPPPGEPPQALFDINVRGTYQLVSAAAQRADVIERFVHVSSDAIYPSGNLSLPPAYLPMDELHPQRPVNLYGMTKQMNESTVMTHFRSHGLRVAIIRPSGMFAGDEVLDRWTVRLVANRLRMAARIPDSGMHHPDCESAARELLDRAESPDQWCSVTDGEGRPWIWQPSDARDIAHACLCALEHPAAVGQAFNATIPHPMTFPEVAAYLEEKTGRASIHFQAPARFVYLIDIGKAKSLIGFRPRCDLTAVFDTALAVRGGEETDVIPA